MIHPVDLSCCLLQSLLMVICIGRGGWNLRQWSILLACMAVIALVITGAPGTAAAASCDPCPPDCAMMMEAAAAPMVSTDHHKAPLTPDAPCKQGQACQASAGSAMLAVASVLAAPSVARATHNLLTARVTPSRPPDRDLRPPIQL